MIDIKYFVIAKRFAYWVIFHAFYRLLLFFFLKINFFEKNLSGISVCKTVWMIWIQSVCQGYQQTTLVGKGGFSANCFTKI